MRAQASRHGLSHLSVRTLHGLAFRYAQGRDYALVGELDEITILDRYCPPAQEGKLLAWLVKDLVNYCLNSDYTRLDTGLLERYRAAAAPRPVLAEVVSSGTVISRL